MSALNSKQALNSDLLRFNNLFFFFCQLVVIFRSLDIAVLPWHPHTKEYSSVSYCL